MSCGTDASADVQIVTDYSIPKLHQKNNLQDKTIFPDQYFFFFCLLLDLFFLISHGIQWTEFNCVVFRSHVHKLPERADSQNKVKLSETLVLLLQQL